MQRTLIFALLLIMVTVVFSLQNSDPIQMKFFFWDINYPPAVLIPLAVFVGALLGVLFSLPALKKKNDKIVALEEQLNKPKTEE